MTAALAGAAALALAGSTASPAGAAARTKVSISDRVPAFNGVVRSPVGACKAKRRIQLFRRTASGKRMIGRDRTSRSGRWQITPDPLKPGAYFAKAKAKRGSVACRAGRSDVIVLG